MPTDIKKPSKKRIACYIRVSTNEQAKEGYGLEVQLNKLKGYIEAREKSHGWVFDEKLVYKDDGYSGALKSRPAFDRLMRDVRNKRVDVVAVMKVDRLYRSTLGLLEAVKEMGKSDVGFTSVTESLDTTVSDLAPEMERAQKQMMLTLFGMLAEFERSLIISRTSEGRLAAAKDGNYVGGNVPFGYDVKDQRLIVNKKEEQWVRRIYVWYVKQGYTRSQIAQKLTKLRVTHDSTRRGRKRTKNPEHFWDRRKVTLILGATHYTGVYFYNKTGKDKNGKRVEKPRSEWVDFSCPAVIDQKTFKKAQEKMAKEKKESNNAKHIYLLSGKIQCGACGSNFVGYMSAKKTKNYRCGKYSKHKTTTPCKVPHISEKLIAEPTWKIVEDILKRPKGVLEKMEKDLKKDSYYQSLMDEREILENRKSELQHKRKRAKEAYMRGVFEIDELEGERKLIDDEADEIAEQLEAINSQLTVEQDKGEKIASLKDMAKKYKSSLKEPSYERKRELLQEIIKSITFDGTNVQLELRVPKSVKDELDSKNKLKTLYGAIYQSRTGDLRVTNPLLYQLS
jgi:site-specific DNA recombinase